MLNHRHLLSAALLAAIGLPAAAPQAALRITDNGVGDALYLPYYTVDDDQETLVTVRNDGDRFVAARVLFTEALNGQAVRSFNIFLPPFGQWTAALSGSDPQQTTIAVSHGVCTVPSAPREHHDVMLYTFRNNDYAVTYADGGDPSTRRTRNGAIEIFEFATLTGALADDVFENDCEGLEQRYQPGPDGNRATLLPLMQAPSGRLAAHAQVVNVGQGIVYSTQAIAIGGFFGRAQDPDPDALLPRLTTPVPAVGTPEFLVDRREGRFAMPLNRPADAISLLFLTEQLSGDAVVRDDIGFTSDFVVSFPTRHAYVSDLPHALTVGGRTEAPFTAEFAGNGACESVTTRRHPGNGGQIPARIGVVFPPTTGDTFCGQVNKREIDVDGDMFQGLDAIDLRGARRSLSARRVSDGQTVTLRGLPAVGLRLTQVINNFAAPNVIANYTFAVPLTPGDVPAGVE